MARKRVGRHPKEFRQIAVERFNGCENIVALASELGLQRTLMYKWRKKFEADEAIGDPVPVNAREGKLCKELGYVRLNREFVYLAVVLDAHFRGRWGAGNWIVHSPRTY